MSESPQIRALRNYRSRLAKQGLARFEVLGRGSDRELLRRLARRLAEDGSDAACLRAEVQRSLGEAAPQAGGILAALRRSPLVGADINLVRGSAREREVDL